MAEGLKPSPGRITPSEQTKISAVRNVPAFAGSVIGQRIGGPVGAAALGGVAAAGGQALGDLLEGAYGGEKRSIPEIINRSVDEFQRSVAIDAAFGAAGKGLKAGAKVFGRGAKGIRRAEEISNIGKKRAKVIRDNKRSLKAERNRLKRAAETAKKNNDIVEASLSKQKEAGALRSSAVIAKRTEKIQDFANKNVQKTLKILSENENKPLELLGKEYDEISKPFLKDPATVDEALLGLEDMVGLSEAAKKIIKTKTSGIKTVGDAIKQRQFFADKASTVADPDIAINFRDTVNIIDDVINKQTGGAFSDLNSRYRDTINLKLDNQLLSKRLSKLSKGEFVSTQAQGAIADKLTKAVSAFTKQAKSKKIIRQGKKVLPETSDLDVISIPEKLANQSRVYRSTKIPELMKAADDIDESLMNIARAGASDVRSYLKDVGVPNKIPGAPNFSSSKLAKEIEDVIFKEEGKLIRNVDHLDRLTKKGIIPESLVSNFIAADVVSAALPSGPGRSVRGLIGLYSIKKWYPILADRLEPIIRTSGEALLGQAGKGAIEPVKDIIEAVIDDSGTNPPQ
jgi:hypothetical protein